MQPFLKLSRYLLPATFLVYSVIANVNFLQTGDLRADLTQVSLLKGKTATAIDTAYVDSLPHREISVGLIGAARYVLIGEGRSGVITGRDGWLFTEEEAGSFKGSVATAIPHIIDYEQRLAASGAKLVLVPIPGKIDVYGSKTESAISPEIRTAYEDFIAELARENIAHIDTRSVLNPGFAPDQTFLKTDTHWSPVGATRTAELLGQSGEIETGDENFTRHPNEEKRLTGDLVSFVTSDHLAPLVGMKPEIVIPYDAVAGTQMAGNIFAADAIDTVLIGTSYSANSNWSFAEALKLSLARDVLNLATEGQGPVVPMQEFLRGPDFEIATPKYVIWEFPIRYLSDETLWQDNSSDGGV